MRRGAVLAALVLAFWPFAVLAHPPPDRVAALRRGVNITGWFRFPASRDPVVLRTWMSDAAMTDLRVAGFTFVRLAVDPAVLESAATRRVFLDQVGRLRARGLAVVVSPHPVTWRVDSNPADRARLIGFWRSLAPALTAFDAAGVFPETMNEPVFHGDAAGWHGLQREVLGVIRAAMPAHTIVLTGHDWGGIGGLLALPPAGDANTVYSFHFYDPVELTSLAAYRTGVDRDGMARLPFPVADLAACEAAGQKTRDSATRDLMRFYCQSGWTAARTAARIREAAAWARIHKVTLLAGEFGAHAALDLRSRTAWLRLVREECARNGIGSALWGYDDIMGFAVTRPPSIRPVLDRSVLSALGLDVP